MPLKLVPPRPGKSPNYTIRGTYLGIYIDRTAKTADRGQARKLLAQLKGEIERGSLAARKPLSFAAAALSYIRAGGESKFLLPLNDYFGDTALEAITQGDIDEAATLLYPDASPATRNRQVYTPLSAIRRHAGIEGTLKRPKGAQGEVRIDWIWPDEAGRLFDAAGAIDNEFRLFLMLLTYCGPRLSEVLEAFLCDDVRLDESFGFVGRTKNGYPRPMHLPPIIVAELANHPRGLTRPGEPVFKFRKNGHLYALMAAARAQAGLSTHVTFHTLRHTWATWMRRYAGLDAKALVDTGTWKDLKSAARYSHAVVSEEARKSDLLPVPAKKRDAS
jgi:integrase